MDLAMAQRLVDRRKAAGLSQEALAAQLGVSRQAEQQMGTQRILTRYR